MQTLVNKKKFGFRKGWKTKLFIFLSFLWPVIHLCVFWGYVNVGTLVNSFFRESLQGELVFDGIEAYRRVFRVLFRGEASGITALGSFLNSLYLMLLALLINLPITLAFSYAIYKKILFSPFWRVVLYLPCVVSLVILCLFFRIIFSGTASFTSIFTILQKLGYSNEAVIRDGMFGSASTAWWGIIIFSVWTGVNGNIIYFSSAMARLPAEVLESARVDGASEVRQFFSIVLPMIWGTVVTMSITLIGGSIAIFQPMQLIVGDDMAGGLGVGTIGWMIVQSVKSGGETIGFPAAVSVVVSVVGGLFVFGFKTLMEKAYKVVEY